MITIRGTTITLQPLSLFDAGRVIDSLLVLKACNPPDDMLRPENRTHLLNVIAVGVHKHIPDASHDEIEESLTLANIGTVLVALVPIAPVHALVGTGHVH